MATKKDKENNLNTEALPENPEAGGAEDLGTPIRPGTRHRVNPDFPAKP